MKKALIHCEMIAIILYLQYLFPILFYFIFFHLVVKCPSIEAPSHGMVSPSTCQIPSGVNYKTECMFSCNVTVGYQLEGASKVSCLESGSWSEDTSKTICRGKNHYNLLKAFTQFTIAHAHAKSNPWRCY